MRILLIRHADPDYSIDSLTERGWKEAQLLSERLVREDIKDFYCSPMGRAKDTLSFTLDKMGREAEILPWAEEFHAQVTLPYLDKPHGIPWDIMPRVWSEEKDFLSVETWHNNIIMNSNPEGISPPDRYEMVRKGVDELLARYGYRRQGGCFTSDGDGTRDTIALVCHFGSGCVILSCLLGISPVLLWHGFMAPPSSVTTIYTEEREKGYVSFRVNSYGDTSHLYAGGMDPAFAGRFCQRFCDEDERH